MKKNIFRGLGVALLTPFAENGSIDFDALRSVVKNLMDGGVDFLCVLGTTAETATLTPEEQRQVVQTVQEVVQGRLPLLLGAGGNNTATVVRHLQESDWTGIDGVLIVCPYYNKPSQEGLYQHFKAVAAATSLPVVLYNVPGRTGVNMEAATTLRIAGDCENVVAIKEASGKTDQVEEIIANAPKGFEVLSGDDGLTLELITLGAVGVISVIGNAYPTLFGKMVHSALEGDYSTALKEHRRLRAFYKPLFADGNPAGVKAILAFQGKIQNVLRLPLVPARKETQDLLRQLDAQL